MKGRGILILVWPLSISLVLIFYMGLVDLLLAGGDFTWSNGRVWSRLDRFIVSPWKVHFLGLCQKHLPRLSSNHFFILLDYGSIHEGWIYFKFENMWLKAYEFVEKVRLWWSSY